MKIVHKDFVSSGPGSVKMVPNDSDDLWYAYQLVSPGDSVTAVTHRKVIREASSGRSNSSHREMVELEIKVDEIQNYDKAASVLRIRGRNVTDNKFVKIGAFHTLELELNRPFVLKKDAWDSSALDVLQLASAPAANSDIVLVLIQEGLAQILTVGESVATTLERIETTIPRKNGRGIASYESAMNKFFDNVFKAFIKHVDFKLVRCAVIASSDFTKDKFREYMVLESERRQVGDIIANKSKILLVHTTPGSDLKNSVSEVLRSGEVVRMSKDTKAPQVGRVLEEYASMELKDPKRAIYGQKDVEVANEYAAVQVLLITDEHYKNADIEARRKNAELMESVKNLGGTVHIISSSHVSIVELKATGIAAILRFPLE